MMLPITYKVTFSTPTQSRAATCPSIEECTYKVLQWRKGCDKWAAKIEWEADGRMQQIVSDDKMHPKWHATPIDFGQIYLSK